MRHWMATISQATHFPISTHLATVASNPPLISSQGRCRRKATLLHKLECACRMLLNGRPVAARSTAWGLMGRQQGARG